MLTFAITRYPRVYFDMLLDALLRIAQPVSYFERVKSLGELLCVSNVRTKEEQRNENDDNVIITEPKEAIKN